MATPTAEGRPARFPPGHRRLSGIGQPAGRTAGDPSIMDCGGPAEPARDVRSTTHCRDDRLERLSRGRGSGPSDGQSAGGAVGGGHRPARRAGPAAVGRLIRYAGPPALGLEQRRRPARPRRAPRPTGAQHSLVRRRRAAAGSPPGGVRRRRPRRATAAAGRPVEVKAPAGGRFAVRRAARRPRAAASARGVRRCAPRVARPRSAPSSPPAPAAPARRPARAPARRRPPRTESRAVPPIRTTSPGPASSPARSATVGSAASAPKKTSCRPASAPWTGRRRPPAAADLRLRRRGRRAGTGVSDSGAGNSAGGGCAVPVSASPLSDTPGPRRRPVSAPRS